MMNTKDEERPSARPDKRVSSERGSHALPDTEPNENNQPSRDPTMWSDPRQISIAKSETPQVLIDEPILLVESDLVFDPELLAPVRYPDRIAVSRQLPWMSGTTVTLDGDGHVNAFHPDSPDLGFQHCTDVDHCMAVNICSLSRDTWREMCRRLDQHVAAGQTGDYYEVIFAEMASEGWLPLTAVILPTDRWYEIDSVADLHAAELVFAGQHQAAGTDGPAVPSVGTAT